MTKKKLLEDIRQNPARIYRTPSDIMRDRRFGDEDRLEILRAWREAGGEAAAMAEIDAMIAELQARLYASNHAAE